MRMRNYCERSDDRLIRVTNPVNKQCPKEPIEGRTNKDKSIVIPIEGRRSGQ